MPSNFCLPPLEYSPGTMPMQAARSRPLRKAAPFPTAAIRARRRHRADSRNLREPLAAFILFGLFQDHHIQLFNACGELHQAAFVRQGKQAHVADKRPTMQMHHIRLETLG